jgi:hypothetical protein
MLELLKRGLLGESSLLPFMCMAFAQHPEALAHALSAARWASLSGEARCGMLFVALKLASVLGVRDTHDSQAAQRSVRYGAQC